MLEKKYAPANWFTSFYSFFDSFYLAFLHFDVLIHFSTSEKILQISRFVFCLLINFDFNGATENSKDFNNRLLLTINWLILSLTSLSKSKKVISRRVVEVDGGNQYKRVAL